MGVVRLVPGILSPYDGHISAWEKVGEIERGGRVGSLGMASTYAILLNGPETEPDRYLWVQEELVTNLMAHQPIRDHSVFDASGRYLGRGGEALDRAPMTAPLSLMEAIPTRTSATPRESAQTPTSSMVDYVFPLRRGILIKISLPTDLTTSEASRLGAFLELLPTDT